MNKPLLVGVSLLVVGLLVGVVAGTLITPKTQTGGDFAGGVVPQTLFTGSGSGGPTGNGYVQPVGSLSLTAANGLSTGGTSQYNAVSVVEPA